jgi:hypothetical protein
MLKTMEVRRRVSERFCTSIKTMLLLPLNRRVFSLLPHQAVLRGYNVNASNAPLAFA